VKREQKEGEEMLKNYRRVPAGIEMLDKEQYIILEISVDR